MANEQNLKPFKPGQSGNPKGYPKGKKNLSTWIQNILVDDSFWERIGEDSNYDGAPIEAIIVRAAKDALNGDAKAREWLGKFGYGTRVKVETSSPIPILGGASLASSSIMPVTTVSPATDSSGNSLSKGEGMSVAQIKGIDLSNYQGLISDLGTDIEFVIIKVTEGTSYVNPDWQEQRDTARKDGKVVLYYHYSDLSDAVAEADHFASTIGSSWLPGEGAAVDWEDGNYSAAIDQWCANFITEFKSKSTVLAMLYSNEARINSGTWPLTRATNAGLWDAAWGSVEPNANPWPFAAIWQNSDNSTEQGVTGPVDTDVFNGENINQLKQYGFEGSQFASAPVTPAPAPQPAPAPAPAPTPSVPVYHVTSGEDLDDIVPKYPGTTVAEWVQANLAKYPNITENFIEADWDLIIPTPSAAPAEPNYTNVTTEAGWGLERIAEAAGRTDSAEESCWQLIAEANGSNNWQQFNADLKAGQVVKVPKQ